MQTDVIVIGGGPSGLMASIAAGRQGAQVMLFDKGHRLGRKLAISGGGRCNVTNRKEPAEMIANIPGNGRFLYSVFSTFNNQDIIHFFEQLGVKLKEEDHGRMFPVSNDAKSVVQAMIHELQTLGVQIQTDTPIKRLLYENKHVIGVETLSGEKVTAKTVVVAVGGKSVPHTGSTGDGYPWAIEAGHRVTELFPTEVPLTSKMNLIREKILQGLSLQDVTLSVCTPKGKRLITHRGDMIFTHFGISGPIALRCSQFVIKGLKKWKAQTLPVYLDLFPNHSSDELFQKIKQPLQIQPKKAIKNNLKPFLPERLITVLLQQISFDAERVSSQLSNEKLAHICKQMKAFLIEVDGTLPIEKAFVTGGGVHLKELEPKALASRLITGLYFCGEILDIHGYTGGYNITAALCTGYVAGKNAAEQSQQLTT